MSLNNCEIFSYEKCINLANSTFNLYVLYFKLAQSTKQFRRLVLENFITVINFFFGRKGILWAKALGFWAAEQLPPPCASKPFPYNVSNMVTHVLAKAFAGTRGGGGGGGGMIFLKKTFSDFYIL